MLEMHDLTMVLCFLWVMGICYELVLLAEKFWLEMYCPWMPVFSFLSLSSWLLPVKGAAAVAWRVTTSAANKHTPLHAEGISYLSVLRPWESCVATLDTASVYVHDHDAASVSSKSRPTNSPSLALPSIWQRLPQESSGERSW
jgi:hypothetical protein